MADLYLLFTDELAQAIAEGRKTVTRRPITKRNCWPVSFTNSHIPEGTIGGFADLDWDAHLTPTRTHDGVRNPPGCTPCSERCRGRDYCCCLIDHSGAPEHAAYLHVPGKGGETRQRVFCRNKPGDMLIVRECWAAVPESLAARFDPVTGEGCRVLYRARDGEPDPEDWENWRWRPSIHMPRWAARSVRKIISITPDLVGVEPLSQDEAEREGFASPEAFAHAWASMYGKHGPRVWAWRYEFASRNDET